MRIVAVPPFILTFPLSAGMEKSERLLYKRFGRTGAAAGSNTPCPILSRDRRLQVRFHDSLYPADLYGGERFLEARFPFSPGIP